jgi:DNA polymerase-3 subunit delta'
LAGNHPDVISINPAGGLIKIGQIRELLATLSMKPFGLGLRVVPISEASAMNPPAANALLKILEEPPDRTVLILMAVQTDSILSTIRSRCQVVRLAPLDPAYIQERIVTDTGLAGSSAVVVAHLAQGSLNRALEMASPQWLSRRAGLLKQISALSELSPTGKLVLADLLIQDKAVLADFLDVAQTWLRDMMTLKAGGSELINQDCLEVMGQRAVQFSSAAVGRCLNTLIRVRKALRRTNPNLRLLVEAMILNWNYTPNG